MERKEKRAIRLEISKLLDFKCAECVPQNCNSCDVYTRIRSLANKISPSKERETFTTKLTAQIYSKLRKEGLTRKEIGERYGIDAKRVKNLVDGWRQKGIIKKVNKYNERLKLTKEEYVELSKTMSDIKIAERCGVEKSTIYKNKRKWGLNREQVSKNGTFTKEIYIKMKTKGMSDFNIAVEIGVMPTVIYYHKKRWGILG